MPGYNELIRVTAEAAPRSMDLDPKLAPTPPAYQRDIKHLPKPRPESMIPQPTHGTWSAAHGAVWSDLDGNMPLMIAQCLVSPVRCSSANANAQLMAAAKELLAALEAVRDGDSCWCHKTEGHEAYCLRARAAIAKARGAKE